MAHEDSAAEVIGPAVSIRGDLFSTADLLIECELTGNVNLSGGKLIIGGNAKVLGNVQAVEVAVRGMLRGDVEADGRVELQAGAHVTGDVVAGRISIEDGAFFKGAIDIVRKRASTAFIPSGVAQSRYSILVERKFTRGLTAAERFEMEQLAAELSEDDASFYEPILRDLEPEYTSAALQKGVA